MVSTGQIPRPSPGSSRDVTGQFSRPPLGRFSWPLTAQGRRSRVPEAGTVSGGRHCAVQRHPDRPAGRSACGDHPCEGGRLRLHPLVVCRADGPEDRKPADQGWVKQSERGQEVLMARLSLVRVVGLGEPVYAGFLIAETSISRLIFSDTITPPASRTALKLTP